MLKTRSAVPIAVGCLMLLVAMTSQGAAAGPELPLSDPFPLVHNAQISSCIYRHPDGTICVRRGPWYDPHLDNDCRCVHTRVISGGGGTPGTVEVRTHTIRGGGGTPGTVEVRRPE
jgi:hypothetical protein